MFLFVGSSHIVEAKWPMMVSSRKPGCSFPSHSDDRVPREMDQEESPHFHQSLLTEAVTG